MKQLVVLCHPLSEHLNKLISTEMQSLSEKYRLEFELRDLYKTGFNPIVSAGDIVAANEGRVLDDVLTEQEYVRNADLLIFIYPMLGMGMPAMMKGYIDRVFSEKFVCSIAGDRINKPLKKKKVILIHFFEHDSNYMEAAFYEQSVKQERQLFECFGMDVIFQYSMENVNFGNEVSLLKAKVEDLVKIVKNTLMVNRNSRLTIPNVFF